MADLTQTLKASANPEKVKVYQRFFKTGKGEYGEGDVFLGLAVPETRKIAKEFLHLSFEEIKKHLQSKYHEERLAALLILVERYKNTKEEKIKKQIVNFYLDNAKFINNWDLVDLTADKILRDYLLNKEKNILCALAKSDNLWERRIAIISTFEFIKSKQFEDTFKISELLLNDNHDLIHKAVGWMLREAGKRDVNVLEYFLKTHYKKMSRIALRYATEKFPEEKRRRYLRGDI